MFFAPAGFQATITRKLELRVFKGGEDLKLEKRYGAEATSIQHVEAFEITEYGRQPSEEEIRKLFPFFPR